mmetsp:Transcript_120867/g.385969  ORF Transcript_120867/g.385969 Transcript_120867/m.385969 type:complete len:217 (-) Transcript_120867:1048-1698(-)
MLRNILKTVGRLAELVLCIFQKTSHIQTHLNSHFAMLELVQLVLQHLQDCSKRLVAQNFAELAHRLFGHFDDDRNQCLPVLQATQQGLDTRGRDATQRRAAPGQREHRAQTRGSIRAALDHCPDRRPIHVPRRRTLRQSGFAGAMQTKHPRHFDQPIASVLAQDVSHLMQLMPDFGRAGCVRRCLSIASSVAADCNQEGQLLIGLQLLEISKPSRK